MNSLSEKRLIIEGEVNGKKAPFLVDTGASISLIDENSKKKYNLTIGRKFNKPLIGAGGDIKSSYICDTVIYINNKPITQFILSDISGVQESIQHETGKRILGIIGLPQLKALGTKIDLLNNTITV